MRRSYRRMAERIAARPAPTPDWVRGDMVMAWRPIRATAWRASQSALPRSLAFTEEIGITTIGLMPHWEESYSPID
ncbi:MAG: hypothetical protein WKF84_21375 [Pyrinomonadaceae bacterium]